MAQEADAVLPYPFICRFRKLCERCDQTTDIGW